MRSTLKQSSKEVNISNFPPVNNVDMYSKLSPEF